MSEMKKRYFRLPYTLTIAAVVCLALQMADAFPSGMPGWALAIGFIAAAIVIAARRFGAAPVQTVPEKYSPRHYFLILWHSIQSGAIAFGLHGALYALFWFAFRLFTTGDEPVFFLILLFVIPAGFVTGAVGRLWEWSVAKTAREIEAGGLSLPASGKFFAPIGSYVWLWQYSQGVARITGKRVPAGGTFCAVFFLGVVGFFIIRSATDYHLQRMSPTRNNR